MTWASPPEDRCGPYSVYERNTCYKKLGATAFEKGSDDGNHTEAMSTEGQI